MLNSVQNTIFVLVYPQGFKYMVNKLISKQEAISKVFDGSSVMVGGFLNCGTPEELIDELVKQNKKELTMICNDTSTPTEGRGKLISNKQVKKVIVSHIGTNPETGRQMQEGELEVDLIPMGSLIERIRAKGAGLGGILTPTGVGTLIEDKNETMVIDGKKFIFERPIDADFAIIYGTKADRYGNVAYYGTTRNNNTMMATAADTVIVQVDEVVDQIDPNEVVVPGLFVDYVVERGADD